MRKIALLIRECIAEIIIATACVIVVVAFIVGLVAGAKEEEKIWNDGYCECGGRWQYIETNQNIRAYGDSVYGETNYLYECDRCGKMHEFRVVR